jgi:hypothetical protein
MEVPWATRTLSTLTSMNSSPFAPCCDSPNACRRVALRGCRPADSHAGRLELGQLAAAGPPRLAAPAARPFGARTGAG